MSTKNIIMHIIFLNFLTGCFSQPVAPIIYKGNNDYSFEKSRIYKDIAKSNDPDFDIEITKINQDEFVDEQLDDSNDYLSAEFDDVNDEEFQPRNLPEKIVINEEKALSEIAKKYNLNSYDIAKANNLAVDVNLYKGQIIYLPKIIIYEVKDNDDLEKIAHKFAVSKLDIIRQNHLKAPYKLNKGDILQIKDFENNIKAKKLTAEEIFKQDQKKQNIQAKPIMLTSVSKFIMPLYGKLTNEYLSNYQGQKIDGILFTASPLEAVKAVAPGKVVYASNELKNLGNLVIIRHNKELMTSYGHLDNLILKKGDYVQKGQIIGNVKEEPKAKLYFAVTEKGVNKDPLKYLPKIYK